MIGHASPGDSAAPDSGGWTRSPVLQQLLRRGDAQTVAATSIDAALFAAVGIDGAAPHTDLPVAAVARTLLPGMDDGRWWMHAAPVFCQPDRDNVLLVADLAGELSADDTRELTDLLAPLFDEAGTALQPGPAGWFVGSPVDPRIETTALAGVIGKPILDFLPRGPNGGSWRRVLNEAQMMLHDAPLNQRRKSAGKPAVNSLWFWGCGQLPAPPRLTRQALTIWADYPLARGLAQLAGAPWRPLPAHARDWLEHAGGGDHLIVMTPAVAAGDVAAAFEERWLAPWYAALKSRRLASFTLNPLTGMVYTVTARQAGKWWKFWN